MKLPNLVKIGPYCWDLQETDLAWTEHSGTFGTALCDSQEIRVFTGNKPARVLDTLIHELTHAIFYSYVMDEREDSEERLVTTMGRAWSQVWIDNPKLLKYVNRLAKEAAKVS